MSFLVLALLASTPEATTAPKPQVRIVPLTIERGMPQSTVVRFWNAVGSQSMGRIDVQGFFQDSQEEAIRRRLNCRSDARELRDFAYFFTADATICGEFSRVGSRLRLFVRLITIDEVRETEVRSRTHADPATDIVPMTREALQTLLERPLTTRNPPPPLVVQPPSEPVKPFASAPELPATLKPAATPPPVLAVQKPRNSKSVQRTVGKVGVGLGVAMMAAGAVLMALPMQNISEQRVEGIFQRPMATAGVSLLAAGAGFTLGGGIVWGLANR